MIPREREARPPAQPPESDAAPGPDSPIPSSNGLGIEPALISDRAPAGVQEIVGLSAGLKAVMRQIEVVAETGATVLLLGETGTGKEVFAQAIHALSSRRERPFSKLNCAAIPLGLLESELFGHEKGAFTGAIARKVGRFEAANGGTLLLDEVGDIPQELQPKLLRVLQEQQFERLGGNRVLQVDVRLVAATSLDLLEMVRERRFRSDLYYRLNVFPIRVPALRERAEDIPILTWHFMQRAAHKLGKLVTVIPEHVMEALCSYSWPGNIRELSNFIERAVILSDSEVLHAPLVELQTPVPPPLLHTDVPPEGSAKLEDFERAHILDALRVSGGVVGGPHGAAERLGLKRTTLIYKMHKLGIARRPKGVDPLK